MSGHRVVSRNGDLAGGRSGAGGKAGDPVGAANFGLLGQLKRIEVHRDGEGGDAGAVHHSPLA